MERRKSGGGERDRTDDPLLAKQVLSQLSYTPVTFDPRETASSGCRDPDQSVVGLDGFEPSTPALSRRCSNRLSYRPADLLPTRTSLSVPRLTRRDSVAPAGNSR